MRCCSRRAWSTGSGRTACGAWPGTVERLDAGVCRHMGWNHGTAPPRLGCVAGIAPGHAVLLSALLRTAVTRRRPVAEAGERLISGPSTASRSQAAAETLYLSGSAGRPRSTRDVRATRAPVTGQLAGGRSRDGMTMPCPPFDVTEGHAVQLVQGRGRQRRPGRRPDGGRAGWQAAGRPRFTWWTGRGVSAAGRTRTCWPTWGGR